MIIRYPDMPSINFGYANKIPAGDNYWSNVCCREDVTEQFVRLYEDKVSWWALSSNDNFQWSDDFVREHADKIKWHNVSRWRHLSENFMHKFRHHLLWDQVTEKQTMSKEFIREHARYIDWEVFWRYRFVSEEFIEEFKEYAIWPLISRHQKLSAKYIWAHEDVLDLKLVSANYKISMPTRDKAFDRYCELNNK